MPTPSSVAVQQVVIRLLAAGVLLSGCGHRSVLSEVYEGVHSVDLSPAKKNGPARHAITAEDLVAVRDITGIAVSQAGDKVAYAVRRADAERNDYEIDWRVAPASGRGGPVFVVDGGEARLYVFPNGHRNGELSGSEARWSPDGQWIAFTRTADSQTQLWRVHADGRRVERLTNNAADVEDFAWSEDGGQIFFSVGRDRSATEKEDERDGRDGFLIADPMPPVARLGWPQWPQCVVQRPDSPLVADTSRHCDRRLWVYDFDRRVESPANESEIALHDNPDKAVRGAVKTSPDDRRIAWFENPDPEKYPGLAPPGQLVVAETENEGNKIACVAKACLGFGLKAIYWAPDGESVVLMSHDGPSRATQSLYRWRLGAPEVAVLLRSDEFQLRDCVQSDERLICIREGWTRPHHIVSISLIDGSTDIIADPNPEFQEFAFTKVEKLLYDDGKGVETYGHLIYPARYEAGTRYPIVVVQYRTGGFLRGGTGDEQPVHVYAKNDMFVLSTNMPNNDLLLATAGGSRLEASAILWKDERRNSRSLNAILNALDQLERRGLIDPARIGVTGLSSGASIAEQALVDTDRFAAASVAYANLSPFAYYTMQSKALRETLFAGLHPFSKVGLAMWRERSSGLNPEKVNEPLLIQAADREYVMTLQNYIDLKDAGKPVELFIFPDEYHVKWQPAHRLAVYERNIDWMNFWLRSVESGLTGDKDQYARWRAMRENQCKVFMGDDGRPWYCDNGKVNVPAQ